MKRGIFFLFFTIWLCCQFGQCKAQDTLFLSAVKLDSLIYDGTKPPLHRAWLYHIGDTLFGRSSLVFPNYWSTARTPQTTALSLGDNINLSSTSYGMVFTDNARTPLYSRDSAGNWSIYRSDDDAFRFTLEDLYQRLDRQTDINMGLHTRIDILELLLQRSQTGDKAPWFIDTKLWKDYKRLKKLYP